MSNCVTHHACDCIMDKVIKYEKLQQELESVKAENTILKHEFEAFVSLVEPKLAAEKAEAKELLEALENLLGHLDASLLFPHKERSDLVKAESLMRQAIAKYKGASDGQ